MASPIAETWVNSTLLIKTVSGSMGTAFMIAVEAGPGQHRIYAITNKHVLAEDLAARKAITALDLHHNVVSPGGSVAAANTRVGISYDDSIREHPDPDVDVLAVNVTQLIAHTPNMAYQCATLDMVATPQMVADFDITAGEEVLTVGYPLGLRHKHTNHPLVRSGTIATRIGEPLEDEVTAPGTAPRKRTLRGFLIDGATIPGSSGSPVVLKPLPGRFVKGNIQMGFTPPLLLGIVAETRYAPVLTASGIVPSFAGLGLAFDAITIKETLDLF
jgi:hypothetical protein